MMDATMAVSLIYVAGSLVLYYGFYRLGVASGRLKQAREMRNQKR